MNADTAERKLHNLHIDQRCAYLTGSIRVLNRSYFTGSIRVLNRLFITGSIRVLRYYCLTGSIRVLRYSCLIGSIRVIQCSCLTGSVRVLLYSFHTGLVPESFLSRRREMDPRNKDLVLPKLVKVLLLKLHRLHQSVQAPQRGLELFSRSPKGALEFFFSGRLHACLCVCLYMCALLQGICFNFLGDCVIVRKGNMCMCVCRCFPVRARFESPETCIKAQ